MKCFVVPAHLSLAPAVHALTGQRSRGLAAAVLLALAGGAPVVASAAEAAAELEPVTVTATLSEHDTRLAPASVSIVGREQLEKINPQDLLEAVREVPGVTLTPRQVGGRKTLAVRGMTGDHVLIMVDGRRIIATDATIGHSDYQYGWLPMSAIERVEVIRGPMSTLYGSEALGGVVNMITRKPTEYWEGSVNLQGATSKGADGGAASMAAYLAGPLGDRLDLRLTLQEGYTPEVVNPDDERYSEIEGRRVHAGTIMLGADLGGGHRFEINHFQGLSERFYDDVRRSGVAYQNQYHIQRRQTDAAWIYQGDTVQAQLRGYTGEIEIINRRTNGVSATRPQALSDSVIDGHVVVQTGDRHKLTAGGELRRERLVNDGLENGRDDAMHKALFVQDELGFGDSLTLTTGLRYDHHELFGHELSPRAYLVWQASPELIVKGGYGHAFKAPTLKQISPYYVGGQGPHTFYGNPNVRPETLDSWELGGSWRRGAVQIDASVYTSDVEDLITYRLLRTEGPRRFYQYDNVDQARIRGFEAGVAWQINTAWSWSANLNLMDTEDTQTGEELEYRPDSNLSSSLDWSGPLGWSARVGVQRIGEQYSEEGELPSYVMYDASLAKDIGHAVTVRLAVKNLTDVRLAEESPLFGYAERGRTLALNLGVRF